MMSNLHSTVVRILGGKLRVGVAKKGNEKPSYLEKNTLEYVRLLGA